MIESPITFEIKRGDESLRSAELLAEAKLYRDAVSRCYYAVLHYSRALLITKEVTPKSHQGVVRHFSLHFVKTGIVSLEMGTILSLLQKEREESDYGFARDCDAETVGRALDDARDFRAVAVRVLAVPVKPTKP